MNAAEQANSFIDRVKNLKTFTVTRELDDYIVFRGKVPFDIKANQETAWFNVLAVNQQEAETLVDKWLSGENQD